MNDESCSFCGNSEFYDEGNDTFCNLCHALIENFRVDDTYNGGDEIASNSQISGIMPDLTGMKLVGFGNASVKRMLQWSAVPYFDKTLHQYFREIMNNLTVYEIRKVVDAGTLKNFTSLTDIISYAENAGIKYQIPNKKTLERTLDVYKILCTCREDVKKKNFCHRRDGKYGIIAMIFYYVNKEFDIYYPKKRLASMFGIKPDDISTGSNRLNKVLKENVAIRKHINKTSMSPLDLLKNIQKNIPCITNAEKAYLRFCILKMKDFAIYQTSPPIVILTGTLMNLLRKFKTSYTVNDIHKAYMSSLSTLNKYEIKLKGFF